MKRFKKYVFAFLISAGLGTGAGKCRSCESAGHRFKRFEHHSGKEDDQIEEEVHRRKFDGFQRRFVFGKILHDRNRKRRNPPLTTIPQAVQPLQPARRSPSPPSRPPATPQHQRTRHRAQNQPAQRNPNQQRPLRQTPRPTQQPQLIRCRHEVNQFEEVKVRQSFLHRHEPLEGRGCRHKIGQHKEIEIHQGCDTNTSAAASTPSSSNSGAAAPAPASSNPPASSNSAASTKPAKSSGTSAAKSSTSQPAPPAGSGQVWVNTDSGVYHKEGTRYYGKTKTGKYMSEADAQKAGFHAAKNDQ